MLDVYVVTKDGRTMAHRSVSSLMPSLDGKSFSIYREVDGVVDLVETYNDHAWYYTTYRSLNLPE